MSSEANRPDDEARWEGLLEAETYGEISEAERLELDRLIENDESRRQERQVLAEIASLEPLEPGLAPDDDRMIDHVLQQHARRRRRRRAALWAAAAVVLVPLGAAAALWPRAEGNQEPPSQGTSVTELSGEMRSGNRAEPRDEKITDESEAASGPAQPSAAPPASAARTPSAAELLARAQQARSSRNYGKAIRTYQQLLRLHPRSGEARLAQLSVAQLQLAQGNAAGALSGFNAYQRSGGGLSQEAHYGKIQALRALGRTAEERAEIRRFLERYPKSVQGAALRRRLGAEGGKK